MELSEEQIQILKIFYELKEISVNTFSSYDIDDQSKAFEILCREKYLIDGKTAPYQIPGVIGFYPVSIQISEKGKASYERYCASVKSEQREIATLETAKEANKKSHNANVLSLIAIIVPSLISVGALIVSILAYLKN